MNTYRTKLSPPRLQSGFTLVELIVAIVILAVLSAVGFSRFADMRGNASDAAFQGVVGAFKSGVHEARAVWMLEGNDLPAENLQVFDTGQSGQIDFNANGWPSQQWFGALESNPTLNNVADCISVANGILQGTLVISNATDADYNTAYLGSNSCRYTSTINIRLRFTYDSNSGNIEVD